MKVRPKDVASIGGWFRPTDILMVLAIRSTPTTGSQYLLWSQQQSTAALFSAAEFDVVDDSVPPQWVVGVDLNGYVELAPRAWLSRGFWERYHDGDANAVLDFEREVGALQGK